MIRAKYVLVLLTVIFIGGFAASTSDASPLKRQQQQQKIFGVMDDRPVAALAAQAGFNVIKKTVLFTPTQWHWNALNADYRDQLTTDMAAAQAAHISVILEMYPVPKYGPPLGATQQSNTCMLAKDLLDQFPETYGIEIGVEPNNYTFWRPQFKPDGTQASAAAYEQWLAKCYDVVKAGHPDVMVIGGSLSSRGDDDPHKPKSGTSPTAFLQKFCEAYKASGRDRPVMDVIDVHSYPDPEDQDPAVQHPYPSTTITIADAGKLEELLNSSMAPPNPSPRIFGVRAGTTQRCQRRRKKAATPVLSQPLSAQWMRPPKAVT